MSQSITFKIRGLPEPKGSMKAFLPKGAKFPVVTTTNRSLRSWETLVRQGASREAERANWKMPQRGIPLTAYVSCVLPRPASLAKRYVSHTKKPDLDKLIRAVLDAMTGILYTDDSQITHLSATKRYTHPDEGPFCVVRIGCDEWL